MCIEELNYTLNILLHIIIITMVLCRQITLVVHLDTKHKMETFFYRKYKTKLLFYKNCIERTSSIIL